ncbi:barstar family protein [Kitasatospora sp. NBC_01287]|uniref:barstar family protein n=1 Tax=Kitasatospora sp. NBC_01287 TaxID=2903573 RepID=UPI0022530B10|nr:barstar family protein [Kitasatospora sp. NBC_01287]MCX4749764.1 barstar family protein [Kitasatospora sp. NBC_01287]
MSEVGPGCTLTSDEDEDDFWGRATATTGLFTPLRDGSRRVRLLGCAPRGGLRAAAERIGTERIGTGRAPAGNANVLLLDAGGAVMGEYFVNSVTVEAVRPAGGTRGGTAAGGDGPAELLDLTVRLWCANALPHAGWPWELRRTGTLDRPGLWRSLGPAGRRGWLSVALFHHAYRELPDQPGGTTYQLDGRHVVDEDSFYCALGEAVNGPGGYFGWNLDALDDCLSGRWGALPPLTVEWRHSKSGREHLPAPFLATVLEIFAERGSTLTLR